MLEAFAFFRLSDRNFCYRIRVDRNSARVCGSSRVDRPGRRRIGSLVGWKLVVLFLFTECTRAPNSFFTNPGHGLSGCHFGVLAGPGRRFSLIYLGIFSGSLTFSGSVIGKNSSGRQNCIWLATFRGCGNASRWSEWAEPGGHPRFASCFTPRRSEIVYSVSGHLAQLRIRTLDELLFCQRKWRNGP